MSLPAQMIAASALFNHDASQPLILSRQGEVQTWLISISAFASRFASSIDNLNADEQQRALGMRIDTHRKRYQYSRAILRLMLSRYTGIAAHEITFKTGSFGKPSLSDQHNALGISFNLSHSADWLLLGFSTAGAIGVDIEEIAMDLDHLSIAQSHFSAADHLAISRQAPDVQAAVFVRCWTGKEAVSKVRGLGLQLNLASFETLDPEGKLLPQVSISHADAKSIDHYHVYALPAPLHFNAALAWIASKGDSPPITAHHVYF